MKGAFAFALEMACLFAISIGLGLAVIEWYR